MTPQEIVAKMRKMKDQSKKKLTSRELVTISEPVWKKLCVNPRYNKDIAVHVGSSQHLKKSGVPNTDIETGHSYRHPSKGKHEVWVNTDNHPAEQILTLAHETGHLILKNATKTVVGKSRAERMANATERVFIHEFNRQYKAEIPVKPKKTDMATFRKNIEGRYKLKSCKF